MLDISDVVMSLDKEKENVITMNRSDSVKSTDSNLSFTSDDLNQEKSYSECPWDVYGDHEAVGRVKIAKVGDKLPLTTGYKAKKDGKAEVGVKFK